MQSQTHDVSFTDTEVRKRFLSWTDGEADREWGCLNLIWRHAPGVAPRPIGRETANGHPVVIMERLHGVPLGGSPLTATQMASLGHALRQIFRIPVEDIRAAGIGERRYGPSMLPRLLTRWLSQPHDLALCEDPLQVSEGVEAARAWLARSAVLPQIRLVGLGIADLNPANIIWDGKSCRLVDFEDGGLTDPAYDLADHVEHIAARTSGIYDPDAISAAVELSADERDRMHAYRPLWAAFWLAMLLPGNGGFTRNPMGTTEAQAAHLLKLIGA